MNDAAAQLKRIMTLIPEIADGDERPLVELAGRLGVSPATVLADLQSIAQRFDEPGGFIEPLQLFLEADRVSATTNHFLRPMRLTVAELRALELGLVLLRAERPPEERAAIDRARQRLAQAAVQVPGGAEIGVYHGQTPEVGDPSMLKTIRRALRECRKLTVEYRRGDAAETSTRLICPYEMVIARGKWYLVAHCHASNGLRIFRLDRMVRTEVESDRFDMPSNFSAASLLTDGRAFAAEKVTKLKVRYSARIAPWIAEREPGTREADGSLIVEHPMADVDWAVRHVLQYGPEAEVLEPESVRHELRGRLAIMSAEI